MNVINIASDNPKSDQWKSLSQFAYQANITRYLLSKGLAANPDTVNYIAGCIRQSEAYFLASETSPIDISPLLLYYGATNLLAGASAMFTGDKPSIKHHGLRFCEATIESSRIADIEIIPDNPRVGALQNFCNLFSDRCPITTGGKWSLEEIFGSVPDLIQEFENCYQNAHPFCIPVKVSKYKIADVEFPYELINTDDLKRFKRAQDALDLMTNLKAAFITPRYDLSTQYIPLYYRRKGTDIGIYSVFGGKYLQLAHIKNNQPLIPKPIITMFMGLYTLGYMSRYFPERWNPFVRTDDTGERLVVEKFISICQRYFPNLVLNEIKESRMVFTNQIEGNTDNGNAA